jgi:hypothetical protein
MNSDDADGFSEDDEDLFAVYDELFAPLEAKFGPLDDEVLSSPMMMFGMSFSMREADGLYVTYEPYHLIETQSREGLKFALFMISPERRDIVTDLLEAIAQWVLENEIGNGDTIDLSAFEIEDLPAKTAEISLFSQQPEGFGLYEVRFKPH